MATLGFAARAAPRESDPSGVSFFSSPPLSGYHSEARQFVVQYIHLGWGKMVNFTYRNVAKLTHGQIVGFLESGVFGRVSFDSDSPWKLIHL